MSNESDNKPVAWQWMDTGHFRKKIPANAANPADWRALGPIANPLTDEQIDAGRRAPWGFNLDAFTAGVRFAERKHGISQGADDA